MKFRDGMKLVEFLNYLDDSQTVRLVASYVEPDKNIKNFEHIIRSSTILEGIAGGACMVPYDKCSVFGIKFKDTIPEIFIDVDYQKLFEDRYQKDKKE